MSNEHEMMKLIKELDSDLSSGLLVTDKSGVSTVERSPWLMQLDPTNLFLKFGDVKETNRAYVAKELAWYQSMDLSVRNEFVGDISIWQKVAASDGTIVSNYGWMLFSSDNYHQYNHVVEELTNHPLSRRAQMIYTRPSMWVDYNRDGRSDFCCTAYTQHFIRDGKLNYQIQQRSADLVYGALNDLAFHGWVYQKMMLDLKKVYPDLKDGTMAYYCNSIHVYERHFDLLRKMAQVKLPEGGPNGQ